MSAGVRGRAWVAAAALVVLASLLSACPDVSTPSIAKDCTKFGDKCVTPKGPLGVCESVPCKTGQPGPCLSCNPQH